ncbi:MAG: MBOAT family protein, partial [Lachnospiraceae bacterium]|nr:MBOAT family protein [Lachnospiraceae bacterium]
DVYRGKIKAEKDLIAYGAFISFFPPLLSGPIERADNLLVQIKREKIFSEELIRQGFGRMLWGYFQKVVIADRIAVLVTAVYDNYESYTGIYVLAATLLYAFQIYCDFAGYSNLAIGASEMLGFRLRENFCMPYFSTDISEFWKRWHISLSGWLKDYVYISLGGNRKGKMTKYRNLLITFLVSGLWHGANITFVLWGLLHGIYQIFFDLLSPLWKKWQGRVASVVKAAITFLLVDFAWLFFRASSVRTAFGLLGKIFFDFQPFSVLDRQLAITMGMEIADLAVLAAALVFLVLAELLSMRWNFRKKIGKLPLILRWGACYIFIFIILIFGYYGPGFDLGQFIYAQF